MIGVVLTGAAALLLLAPFAVVIGNHKNASAIVYAGCCAVSLALLIAAATQLLGRAPATMALPLGLPWVGAHFRLDALSAFFLIVSKSPGGIARISLLVYSEAG